MWILIRMKVLVTGSEGSLCQWVIPYLQEQGHEVVGVDNRSRYDDGHYDDLKQADGYEFHKLDLNQRHKVTELFLDVQPDAVIQAAALIYGVKGFHDNCADIISHDVAIVRNVLDAARAVDVDRVALISSSMVYEKDEPPHIEGDEDSMVAPSTEYGLSKLVEERMCKAYHKQYDLDYTIWRPFNVITPHEKAEDESGISHVFADFIRKIVEEEQNPMEIFGDGEQTRCFTWIDEIAEAIGKYSFDDETKNEGYNLANVEPVTMKTLARIIYNKANTRELIDGDDKLEFDHVEIYDDDVDNRLPSAQKAKVDLGWDATIELEKSVDRILEHMFTYDLE